MCRDLAVLASAPESDLHFLGPCLLLFSANASTPKSLHTHCAWILCAQKPRGPNTPLGPPLHMGGLLVFFKGMHQIMRTED